jgi:hypothetical protein
VKLYFVHILILISFGCSNTHKPEIEGVWSKCNEFGDYYEWHIGNEETVLLGLKNEPQIVKSKIDKTRLILFRNDLEPIKDTFDIIRVSEKELILHRKFMDQTFSMIKKEAEMVPVDSSNINHWKQTMQSSFNKRKIHESCEILKSRELYEFSESNSVIVDEIETPIVEKIDSLK